MLSWEQMLDVIKTKEQYTRLISIIFEDGNYNEGRWLVIRIFTKDLGKRYPEMKEEFLREYDRFRYEKICEK